MAGAPRDSQSAMGGRGIVKSEVDLLLTVLKLL